MLAICLAACAAGEKTHQGATDETGPYAGLEPVELIGADSTGKGAAGQIFGELVAANVAEITNGKLTIDYHPNGDLGGDTDLLRQAQDGDIDIVVCQTAPMVNFIPEMAVFDLPMAFAKYDGDTIDEVLNGANEFNAALREAYYNGGYHLLGFMQNGTYRLTTANVDLSDLRAFSALQIRTMENANHMAFWSAIGAEPTPLAWAEVYIALQNGTIDAQENAADTCVGANFQEVQKYLACTNHILYVNQMLINRETYESLHPSYQAALEQAVDAALNEMNPKLKQIDEDNKKLLTDGGMTLIEYDDSFFDSILALPGVQELYKDIDGKTEGLATALADALENQAQ
ncbi:MAG: TRAP transporter substrate-binding protein [Clostridia bacterium]|nr:TRAP transporter substrate-binding protein [Clostridia bacterium]